MSILFYTFEDQYHNKIRTIMRDNAPWFVLDDLAKVLGYAGSKDIPRDNCPNIDWFMPREIEEMNIGIMSRFLAASVKTRQTSSGFF